MLFYSLDFILKVHESKSIIGHNKSLTSGRLMSSKTGLNTVILNRPSDERDSNIKHDVFSFPPFTCDGLFLLLHLLVFLCNDRLLLSLLLLLLLLTNWE